MGILDAFLTGVALAMDAFAVSISKGMGMKRVYVKKMLLMAGFFGGFQLIMPLIGWWIGDIFSDYLKVIGPWLAFGVLAILGLKAIIEAIREEEDEDESGAQKLEVFTIFLLAIATSIDAFFVGVAFSVTDISIVLASVIIGVTTFFISEAGVFIGCFFGSRFKKIAQILGGILLVLIGLKILILGG